MKTNKSLILPVLLIPAALLLLLVNVETIAIGIFSVGLLAITFSDVFRSLELAPLPGRRPAPAPANAFPMGAQSVSAAAR
ncbi:MAG: hypothetical protein ABSA05_09020 [Opitutaceae bacterium]|jgi:hypothetical protein